MGVGAAGDIVLNQPVGVQGAQDTQHVQVRLGVENVVNDTLRGKSSSLDRKHFENRHIKSICY